MAISHIGRVLRDRAERERLKTANNLLEGAATDLPKLHYYISYAEGIKWAMAELEAIETEGS